MLTVVLVDDEPLAVERLRVALQGVVDVQIVGEATDGDQAADLIARLKPDLVVLDIQMPGQTGLAVAGAFRDDHRPEVIFVTAFDQYAPEAFDVEAADYLLKPVGFERLQTAVSRARRRIAARSALDRAGELEALVEVLRAPPQGATIPTYDQELWVPSTRGMVRVSVAQIVWIEAARDYVLIHTPLRSLILRQTISGLAQRLDPTVMTRVHRSALVRLACVVAIGRQGKGLISLELEGGARISVGPSYTKAVLQQLAGPGGPPVTGPPPLP